MGILESDTMAAMAILLKTNENKNGKISWHFRKLLSHKEAIFGKFL